MKLEKKRYEDIVILRFVGEFDTFNLPLFSERVDRMIEGGDVKFVLDVHLLTFINSSALGYLIRMKKRVEESGGQVVLARPSKFVKKTLVTLGLEQAFPMFETDGDAILHFKRGADIGRLQLENVDTDEALHGSVIVIFRPVSDEGEFPPNQVGRIINLYADGLLFRYEVAADDDPVETHLKSGTKLKLKFRQPFAVKDYYFEMGAEAKDVTSIEDIQEGGDRTLTVRVAYTDIKEADQALLDQFVKDQQIWRDELGPQA